VSSLRASEALRPGIARGFYPERADTSWGWLDRTVHDVQGAVARRLHALPRRLDRFVRTVREHGEALAGESEAKLAQRSRALGLALVREGFSDDVVARSFALVREVAQRAVGMTHYDVQLRAGWAMIHGMLAELEAGEGKTLSATLPAATAALAGIPVHVISVNDYLVQRDAEAMGPVYEALGLSVGAVTERLRDLAARRAAYACDITYVTSKQVAFDYLRDGLERRRQKGRLALRIARLKREPQTALLLRGLCFGIVDEADSVLIDEACTPLILSGPAARSDSSETYRQAVRLARALEAEVDFRLREREGGIEFTERGRQRVEELAAGRADIWSGPRRREEWVDKALRALHCFVRDRHYLVRNGRVEIIDQPTGRAAPDRSWEQGLHQLIEVKEGCDLTPERETLARISYQQFFRRYLRLSGMTGTAREVSRELWSVYRLNTLVIRPRLPVRRRSWGSRVFPAQESKWRAVVARVRQLQKLGRPVLVGTSSLAASEELSERLTAAGFPHRVLNARQDANEAAIVAEAGRRGRITVATNMAGRGTDIRLGPGVSEKGGLHVIATQRAEARRIDRQLFGRCGRQGDPGSYEEILSLEDEAVKLFYPSGIRSFLTRRIKAGGALSGLYGNTLTRAPQWAEERRYARLRDSLTALEEYLSDLLAFSGPGE
jgi:preprotein translocase subunit SecA